MTDWFETLFGFVETSPEVVRGNIELHGDSLRSKVNGKSYKIGQLTTPSLQELRIVAKEASVSHQGRLALANVIGDVRRIHCEPSNSNAIFQVASQFNLLEMVDSDVTPEEGVTGYAFDQTQGPVCAIAAGAATVYRNYFAEVGGKIGQTFDNQIDCLSSVGDALGNINNALWLMSNGYALCSPEGLSKINQRLQSSDESEKDKLRQHLRIGLHSEIEVTDAEAPQNHLISQAYCSALPVGYSSSPQTEWAAFANLILESAYEATICAAIMNCHNHGSNKLFLTKLGGGVFGNDLQWIYDAMHRAFFLYRDIDLDIRIVSYGSVDPRLEEMVENWNKSL
jgi:hypothetical protein